MTYSKILNAAMDAFKQKFMDFCKNSDHAVGCHLDAAAMETLTKVLMLSAQAAGQAGLTEYLQTHDLKVSSVCARGITYRYKGAMDKTFLTLFGGINVSRSIYANDLLGGGYYVPLDVALGLEGDDYATWETREMILFAASSASPNEVENLLGKASLCTPSRTAVQNIITRDGKRMEVHRGEIAQNVQEKQLLSSDAALLVASLDGANVMLREEGKKKGRKAQRPVDKDADDATTAFRNAMVGSFSVYRHDEQGEAKRISSRYIARMPQEKAVTFKEEFERAIHYYNNRSERLEKILLCDGFRAIWKYAESCEALNGYRPLIDFYHTIEHLSKAAEAIFGVSSPEGNRWYHRWREALLNEPDAPQAIIRSIEGYRDRYKLSKSRTKELKTELTFFKRNKRLMTYCEFLKNGFPIGSGPVEAAAKTIVKQRMCRSGMRWNRTGGQHVLTLRAYMKSGTWDDMWSAYREIRKAA
jgi:hypothetical protein